MRQNDGVEVESDRVITQKFTPEFLREFAGVEGEEAVECVKNAAVKFELIYNAVALVGDRDRMGAIPVYVIPSRHSLKEGIRRGVEDMHYWIGNYET